MTFDAKQSTQAPLIESMHMLQLQLPELLI